MDPSSAARTKRSLTLPLAVLAAGIVIAGAIIAVIVTSNRRSECDRWREDFRAYGSRLSGDARTYWYTRNTGELPPRVQEEIARLASRQPEGCQTPELVP